MPATFDRIVLWLLAATFLVLGIFVFDGVLRTIAIAAYVVLQGVVIFSPGSRD